MAINIKLSELGKVEGNKSSTFNSINNIDVSDKSINANSENINFKNTLQSALDKASTNIFVTDKNEYDKEVKRNQVYLNKNLTKEELDKQRAKNQSWVEQTARSLAQIVGNEIILGSLQGFTNIYDIAVTGIKELANKGETVNDFTSGASLALEQAQESMKERLAIYRENPDKAFDVLDFGWWADNFVTVGSTLSLMIPTMTITKGVSTLGKMAKYHNLVKAGKSATAISRDMNRASKLSRGIVKATGVSRPVQLAKTLDVVGSASANAVLQRTLENWQEAREVYKATYDDALNRLNELYTVGKSEEEEIIKKKQREEFIKNNPEFEGKSKEEIASLIAEKSGYKTFATDYAMLIMDVAQFAGINSMWRGLANRRATGRLRIANKNLIKGINSDLSSGVQKTTLTEAGKRIIDGADNKLIKNNFINRIKENIKHPGNVFWNLELSEGVEEGYQAIMTEKGKEVADFIFDPNTDARSLESYLTDPTLWEQAVWGILGGLSFKAAGTVLGNLENKIKGSYNKKNMSEEDFAKSQLTEEKLRELELAGRYDTMIDLKAKLDLVNEGKNPFDRSEDGKNYKDIEDGQIDAIKASVVNDFLTKLTLDAVDNGNFDLLVDFVTSNEFNQYLKDVGIYDEMSNKFNNTLIENMKDIRETYQQELHKGLEYEDIESPWLINILARLNTRKRLTIQDLDSELNVIENELNVDIAYENEAQRQYHQKVLNNIEKRYTEIEKAFRDNTISREAFDQYVKDFNEELDILWSELTYPVVWSKEGANYDLDHRIADLKKAIVDVKNEQSDLYKQDNTNTPTAEQLVLLQKKLNLKWQQAKEDASIARTDYQWKRDYERLERSMTEEGKKRYENAKEVLKKYINESEDIDDAVENLMTGNFNNPQLQKALDLIKIGYHNTHEFWSEVLEDAQVEAISRAERAVADNTTTIDGNIQPTTPDITSGIENEIEDLLGNGTIPPTGEPKENPPAIIDNNDVIEEPINPPIPEGLESGIEPTNFPVEDNMPELADPQPIELDKGVTLPKVNEIQETQYKITKYIQDNIKNDIGIYINDLILNGILERDSYNKIFEEIKNKLFSGNTKFTNEDIAKMINEGIYSIVEAKKMIKELKGQDAVDETKLLSVLGSGRNLASEFSTINIVPLDQRTNKIFEILKGYVTANNLNNEIDIVNLFNYIVSEKPNISYLELLNIYRLLEQYISKGITGNINGQEVKFTFNNQSKTIYKGGFDKFLFNKVSKYNTVDKKNDRYLSMEDKNANKDLINDIIEGKIKNPNITLENNTRKNGNTLSIIYVDENNKKHELGYISKVKKVVSEDGKVTMKNYHSNGMLIVFDENGNASDTNFDDLFTLIHLATLGENNGYDKIIELIQKYDLGDHGSQQSRDNIFTEEDFETLMSLPEIKYLYEAGKEEEIVEDVGDENHQSYERIKGGLVLPFDGFNDDYTPNIGNKSRQVYNIINAIQNVFYNQDGVRDFNDPFGHYRAYAAYVREANESVYDAQERLSKGEQIEVEIDTNREIGVLMREESVPISETFEAKDYKSYPLFYVEDGIGNVEDNTMINSEPKFNGMIGIKLHPRYDLTSYLERIKVADSNSGIIEDLRNELRSIIKGYLEHEKGFSFDEVANKLTKLLSGDKNNKLFSNIKIIVQNGFITIKPYVDLAEESDSDTDIIVAFDRYSDKATREKAKNPTARVEEKHGVLRRGAGEKRGKFIQKYTEQFADEVVDNILQYLKFNLFKLGFNNNEVTKQNNPYFYKEDGKLVVEIGGNKRVYENTGHFVYSENAARTIVDKVNGKVIITGVNLQKAKGTPITIRRKVITPESVSAQKINRSKTLGEVLNLASKRKNKNVSTRELLESAGLAKETIDMMLKDIDGMTMADSEIYIMSKEQRNKHKNAYAIYDKNTNKVYLNSEKIKKSNDESDVRVELVRTLIHENFHKLFNLAENNPIKRKEVINELLETYIKFKESLTEQKDSNILAKTILDSFKKFLNKYNIKENKLYINDKQATENQTLEFVEEWLVESLTQPALLQYNNQVEYKETDLNQLRGKPQTIFQKIINAVIKLYKFIAKSFKGIDFKIKNNTILAKQYMLLATELGNSLNRNVEEVKEVTEEKPINQEVEKVGEQPTTPFEGEQKSSPVEGETAQQTKRESRVREPRKRRQKAELFSEYGLIDYDAENIEDAKLQSSVSNENVNTNGVESMNNVNEFIDRFSEEEKLKLANLKAQNKLNYVCQ